MRALISSTFGGTLNSVTLRSATSTLGVGFVVIFIAPTVQLSMCARTRRQKARNPPKQGNCNPKHRKEANEILELASDSDKLNANPLWEGLGVLNKAVQFTF
ncbi:hypothetical protein B0H16DRAFT_1465502 [Mycena metata]|uniref:Uncharacterized protein n=1 Tax=Mycena metata TaxID=1033252 RepID=A0AAD7ICN1_9AGAR|nr:hypothetical protein B0H16DRAFT_1465502 [Mycena metata]